MDVRKQCTIEKPFEVKGVGIHSGGETLLRIKPAAVDHGIVFKIDDVLVPANVGSVVNLERCTTIGVDGKSIATVEHLLAACWGLGVDNLLIEAEGSEMPILDGSALEWVRQIKDSGIVEQDGECRIMTLDKPVKLRMGESFIIAVPEPGFSVTVVVEYDHPEIGMQMAQYNPAKDSFEEKLAPARTFGFKKEVQALLDRNLAKGGSLDNALIIDDEGYMNEPRFEDEPVRHKCLDFLGDLKLAGIDFEGHFFAYKPGHRLHVEFLKKLVKTLK